MTNYEYLVLKRNGNKEVYDKSFFDNSKDARKDFKKNDVLLKCKLNSIYLDMFGWSVDQPDVIKKYEK